MSALWDLLLSPTGLALYVAFWIFKLTAGAWVLNKALVLVPVHVRARWRARMPRLLVRRRGPRT